MMRRRMRLTILAVSFGLVVSLLIILQAHAQVNGFTFLIAYVQLTWVSRAIAELERAEATVSHQALTGGPEDWV